jgi:hypothetical protein
MDRTQFVYKSRSPSPRCDPQKNLVTVWKEDGVVHYERRYITQANTEPTAKWGLSSSFEKGASVNEIASMIHWGCSGTSKNSLELRGLIEDIRPVVESLG